MTWRRYWMTLIFIGLSIFISMLVGFGDNRSMMRLLTFSDFSSVGAQISYYNLKGVVASGEWWRFFSPMFMHFSMLHLVFNLLWIWVVGTRIEQSQGPVWLLVIVLISGGLSNLAQFLVSGPLFGGMSGVVYAVLGYAWLWDRMQLRPRFYLPQGLMGFMVVWLLLGYTGLLGLIGFGAIANTAHLVGLLVGLLLVLPGHLLRRYFA
ncbi:rhomboid family intramembrane serine protease [Nitrincola tibetensis]|uniref:Rhomboid family intramembrane serine protease n=1 Tax=Nitrincola tibetensis TaxID=2219697 RepID=A0A364NKY6_9GAMM|nr:rhomboid family intramembrane serine protease [Nitrincola tibetensis]RAU17660.1 rhomboid family intramembrane serine protease [Nitrincola tibetensis]